MVSSSKMKILHGIADIHSPLQSSVVTIGNFDGLHLGHRRIVRQVIDQARALDASAIVFTFRPHPQMALKPSASVDLINTYEEKLEMLEALGVDMVVEQPFSRDFSTISPEVFFNEVLLKKLSARALYVGYDFGFGRGRAGGLDLLRQLSGHAGIETHVMDAYKVGDVTCSSSQIREMLRNGSVEGAAMLLGRLFYYRGVVTKGDGRGHKIGFPTANIQVEGRILVKNGVYATEVVCRQGVFKSVTNVGSRPTFVDNGGVAIETHILDFDSDIYGEVLEVRFKTRLRDERKFSGIDELVAQIKKDVEAARALGHH